MDLQAREERLARLREQKRLLTEFLFSPGWRLMEGALEQQIVARQHGLFSSGLQSMDDAFRMAKEMGEVQGLKLAKTLAQVMFEAVEADLKAWTEELRRPSQEVETENLE